MTAFTLTVLMVTTSAAPDVKPQAEVAPTPAQVRDAVARALPAVEKAGVRSFHDKCISCHNVGFLLWGHTAARDAGFTIDKKKFAAWNDESLQLVHELRIAYKLTPASVDALRADGVADEVLVQLKPLLNQGFPTEATYRQALKQRLADDLIQRHGPALVKRGRLSPLQNSLDAETAAQLLLSRGARPEGSIAAAAVELTGILVQAQRDDGSWKAGGQSYDQRRPNAETEAVTTLWAVLALASLEKPGDDASKARDKALGFLKNVKPGESNESLLLLMLVEKQCGKAERATELQAELLKRQNADGGWAWRNGEASDAVGTGQALFALGTIAGGTADAQVRQGWRFLLAAQQKDGSWQVPYQGFSSKKKPNPSTLTPVYRYWGTTWATIGLAHTLPR
jgi:squalene-hopene/tetraprenyl-beta-curcumene cyclase